MIIFLLFVRLLFVSQREKENAQRKAMGFVEELDSFAFGGRFEFRCAPLTPEKAQSLIKLAATKPKKEVLEYHYLRTKFLLIKVSQYIFF